MKLPENLRICNINDLNVGDIFLIESTTGTGKKMVIGFMANYTHEVEGGKMIVLLDGQLDEYAGLLTSPDTIPYENVLVFSDNLELHIGYDKQDYEFNANISTNQITVVIKSEIIESKAETNLYLRVPLQAKRGHMPTDGKINIKTNEFTFGLHQPFVSVKKWQIGFKQGDDFKSILASD